MRPRLEALADAVPADARALADVGYDRATLLRALLERRPALTAIGVEIQPDAAARLAREAPDFLAAVGPRLALRHGDALTALSPGEVDGVIMAGIDATHIAAILAASPAVVARLDWLLLCPTRFQGALRPALAASGLFAAAEWLVHDRGRTYEIVLARHGVEPHPDPVARLYGPRLFERRDPLLVPYLEAMHRCFEGGLASGFASYGEDTRQAALGRKLAHLEAALALARRP